MKPRRFDLRRRTAAGRPVRAAFSMLEVILALAILAGSLAVIGQLNDLGLRGARRAASLAEAQLLCDSKLAEIAAGFAPATSVGLTPCETDPHFFYSVNVAPLAEVGLLSVQVTVVENLPGEPRPTEFSLVRWMIDPQVAAEEAAQQATTTTTGSTTSTATGAGT